MRHGYRGPEKVLGRWAKRRGITRKSRYPEKTLSTGPLSPAVVTSASPQEAVALTSNGTSVSLNMEGVRWARRFISDTQQGATPRKVNDVVQAGQQVGSPGG